MLWYVHICPESVPGKGLAARRHPLHCVLHCISAILCYLRGPLKMFGLLQTKDVAYFVSFIFSRAELGSWHQDVMVQRLDSRTFQDCPHRTSWRKGNNETRWDEHSSLFTFTLFGKRIHWGFTMIHWGVSRHWIEPFEMYWSLLVFVDLRQGLSWKLQVWGSARSLDISKAEHPYLRTGTIRK